MKINRQILPLFAFFNIVSHVLYCQNEKALEGKVNFHSNILNEERTYLVKLPSSYNDVSTSEKKYPIMILLDGYSHFNTATEVVNYMSSEVTTTDVIPETIIVSIINVDRERDFTVTKIKTVRPNTMGGGRKFLNFIEKELIPQIDKNYRTLPFRTLVGHSLGGLLTLNSYMDKNSLFDAYLAIDPSVWWDANMMKSKVNMILSESFDKKLFIATANQGEANYTRNKKRHYDFYEMIMQKTKKQATVKIKYYQNENHRTVPLMALCDGLEYLNSKK